MPKNPMQDIVPRDGRSIRNVPVPESRTVSRPVAPRIDEPRLERPARRPAYSGSRTLSTRQTRPAARPSPRPEPVEEEEAAARPAPAARPTMRREAPVREIVPEPVEKPSEEETVAARIRRAREEFEAASMAARKPQRMTRVDREEAIEAQASADEPTDSGPSLPPRHRKGKGRLWLGAAVAGVIGLAILASTVFHSAVMTLKPRSAEASVAGDYTARKAGAGTSELVFETVSVQATGSETVRANGEKQVETRATGVIVIYNDYGTAAQRLIKNTRFETPEGLVFRISDSVTVPGKKGTTPGSVEASVIADEAGTKYNVGLKDFTIPGFKGDPRYTSFYARSKTPIQGGFSGVQKIVAEADRAKAVANIESKIAAELKRQIAEKIPEGKVFFDDAYVVTFTDMPEEAVSDTQVTLKKQGTLTAAVFDKVAFSEALAQERVQGYAGEPVQVRDWTKVTFTPKAGFNPASQSIAFGLGGTAAFDWTYDEVALKTALKGQSRQAVQSVLGKFPMIQEADISIRPFWRTSFPDSLGAITVRKAE